jgi:SAM-dependent methyltransferase
LASLIEPLLPQGAQVLDVGCGDGQLGAALIAMRPDIHVSGVDVLLRPNPRIPVVAFDGSSLPHADASVDVVLLADVVHHCLAPMRVLGECGRVCRRRVVIKDHLADGIVARPLLRFMDFVGNAGHGVALPYNYWTKAQWRDAFSSLDWKVERWAQALHLYPWPADWVFGGSLHFLACLTTGERHASSTGAS